MSMTNALGSESDGIPITWKGRIYKMMPIDLKGEGAFVEWMKMRGRLEIIAMRDLVEPEILAKSLAEFGASAPAKFTFWGPEGVRNRRTVEGVVKIIHISIQKSMPKFTEVMAQQLFDEESDQVLQALKDFFEKKKPQERDSEESENTPTPLDLEVIPQEKLDLLSGKTETT